jgi:hypothetical protein
MDASTKLLAVVIVSELVAAYAIWRISRSSDSPWMTIALAVIALLPVAGPPIALWIANFPDKAAESLQNRRLGAKSRGWYYLRWNGILSERNPVRRFKLWRSEVERDVDADP